LAERRLLLLRPLAATAAAVLVAACAVPSRPPPPGAASELALTAAALVGVPYHYGGEDPATGFDCSGLVRYAARSALAIELPRQAEDIGQVGTEVRPDRLRSGDLVFFNTLGRPYSHVGIYLGDDRFVHAPTRGGRVRIERLSQRYWQARFDGARRLAPAPEEEFVGDTAIGGAAADSTAPLRQP
jgi:cell wall-associated NlpC family hydrolase